MGTRQKVTYIFLQRELFFKIIERTTISWKYSQYKIVPETSALCCQNVSTRFSIRTETMATATTRLNNRIQA